MCARVRALTWTELFRSLPHGRGCVCWPLPDGRGCVYWPLPDGRGSDQMLDLHTQPSAAKMSRDPCRLRPTVAISLTLSVGRLE